MQAGEAQITSFLQAEAATESGAVAHLKAAMARANASTVLGLASLF